MHPAEAAESSNSVARRIVRDRAVADMLMNLFMKRRCVGLYFGLLTRYYIPRVDIYAGVRVPPVLAVDEECHGVVVLTVEIILIAHRLVVFALDHEHIADQGYAYDAFAVGQSRDGCGRP